MTQSKRGLDLVDELNLKRREKKIEKRIQDLDVRGSEQKENDLAYDGEPTTTDEESQLAFYQRRAPLGSDSHWAKMESLTIREAILLYYGIDPDHPHGVLEGLFDFFLQQCDEDRLGSLLESSLQRGTLQYEGYGKILTTDFCTWLTKKGFKIPECFSEKSTPKKESCQKLSEEYEGSSVEKPEPSLRECQKDQVACGAICQILWELYPNMSIKEVTKHPWIQKYGNGSQYTGKHTLRNWVKPFDPRPENEKIGRPPKSK